MTTKGIVEVELKSYIHTQHDPMDYVTPQSHSCYEMVFYASGEGKTTIGEELYDFGPGDMAIIEPETVHDELSGTTCEVYCCLFTYQGVLPLENGLYSLRKLEHSDEVIDNILQLFMQIKKEMFSKCLEYESVLNFLMGQLVIAFYRTRSNVRSMADGIEYVKMYIKENYTRGLNFHILAHHVGYSYDRLRHIFKERVGISPSRYLLNVRIKRAKEMLTNTDHPIERVAKSTGFGSASRFVEVFRNETGQTPGKYRIAAQASGVSQINF